MTPHSTPWAVLADSLPAEARPACWAPRTSILTASGTPIEASVSAPPAAVPGAAEGGGPRLRVVVDPGAGEPPEGRIAAGLAAAKNVGQLLDPPGRAVVEGLADALRPCWEEERRGPWTTWVGASIPPGGRAVSAKVYARLTSREKLERLAEREGPATAALSEVLAGLPPELPVDWRFAGWDLAPGGGAAAKVYLTTRSGDEHAVLSWLARRSGVDAGAVLDALAQRSLDRVLWLGELILAPGWSEAGWRLGVHASPPVNQAERWRIARALGAGVEGWDRALDDLAATAGAGVHVSWFGLGFVPPDRLDHASVYLAPR